MMAYYMKCILYTIFFSETYFGLLRTCLVQILKKSNLGRWTTHHPWFNLDRNELCFYLRSVNKTNVKFHRFIFFPLSYYPLIITPRRGLTASQFLVVLAFIQSWSLLHSRLGIVADIVISCSVVFVVELHSRVSDHQRTYFFKAMLLPFTQRVGEKSASFSIR